MSTVSSRLRKFFNEHKLQTVAVLSWILLILAGRLYLSINHLHFLDVVKVLEHNLHDHWYGLVIYLLLFIIRPVLFVPATLLTLMAGSIWGVKLGFIYALLGATLSSIGPYFLGKWFHIRSFEKKETKRNFYGLQRFITSNAFESILILRLLYMPYDLVSFLAGILQMSFWEFLIASTIGDLAGTLTFVSIGSSVRLGETEHGMFTVHYSQIALSIGIMCVTIIMSQIVKRFILTRYGRKPTVSKDLPTTESSPKAGS